MKISPLIIKRAEKTSLVASRVPNIRKILHDYNCRPARFFSLVCEFSSMIVSYAIYSYGYSSRSGRCVNMDELYALPEYRDETQIKLLKELTNVTLQLGYQQIRCVAHIVGVPTCKNGRVEHINTNLCCYISLQSQLLISDLQVPFLYLGGSLVRGVDIQGLSIFQGGTMEL